MIPQTKSSHIGGKNAFQRAGIFSKMLFWWLSPFIPKYSKLRENPDISTPKVNTNYSLDNQKTNPPLPKG